MKLERRAMGGLSWMALSALLFAVMSWLARVSAETAHFAVIAAVRAAVGVLVAGLVARARGVPAFVHPTRIMWARSALGTVAMGCTFFALSRAELPLGDASTLFSLSPVFIAVLAPLVLREQGRRRDAVALVLSLGGTLFVLRPPLLFGGAAPERSAITPAVVAVVGAGFSALAMLSLRRATKNEPVEAIATHFSLVAAVVFGAAALALGAVPPVAALLPMVGAGACAGLGQLAMTRAYALEPAARVSPVGYLQIVFTSLLGAALLGERPSLSSVAGIGLVILGGLLLAAAGWHDRHPA